MKRPMVDGSLESTSPTARTPAGRAGWRHIMCRWLLPSLLLWLPADAARAAVDWTGTWETRWRDGGAQLHLDQTGNGVRGTYPLYEGTITATAEGRALEGTWSEASGRTGRFRFVLSRDGETFAGRFASGEWWTGIRISASAIPSGETPDRSSPRAVLRSFLRAGNAARDGSVERLRPALEAIDFTGAGLSSGTTPGGGLLPQQKIDYGRRLLEVLDQLTFRLWDLPGPSRPETITGPRVVVTLRQSGTGEPFDLTFVRADNLWRIAPPAAADLESALNRLYRRRGGEPPARNGHLALATPRDTLRTFIEGMERFGADGRDSVVRTLDLEGYAANIREEETTLMAHSLRHVLSRIGEIVYQEIPDDPRQRDPYRHFSHAAGEIVIAPYPVDDGRVEWRFDHRTLHSLRSLYSAIEDLPVADDPGSPTSEPGYFSVRETLRRSAPVLLLPVGQVEAWQWLAILILFLTSAGFAWIGSAIIIRSIRVRGMDPASPLGRDLRLRLVWPIRGTVAGLLWYLKVGAIGLPDDIAAPVRSLSATLGLVSVTWLTYSGLGVASLKSRRSIGATGRKAVFSSLGFGIARISVLATGALLLASAWALPYSSVLAGLGIGGLAVALAAQHTIQNMIAGFTLLADSPLSVGDFCRYGDKVGTVEEIGLRSTRIRSLDRTLISVPNSAFADMQLENYTRRDRMLLRSVLGLRFETRPDQLRHVLAGLRELLLAHPRVTPEPSRARFIGFGESALNVEVFAYIDTANWEEFLQIQEDLYLRMIDVVEASGTALAFPSQTLYLGRDVGLDRDRATAAEREVAAWRSEDRLPFPDFDLEFRRRHRDTLDYPPHGSPTGHRAHPQETPAPPSTPDT